MPILTLLRRDAAVYFIVAWLVLLIVLFFLSGHGLLALMSFQACAVFLLLNCLAWNWLPQHLPQSKFGLANGVTLARCVGVAILGSFVGAHAGGWAWPIVTLALVLLILDGVDGGLARRFKTESEFGARFDMETDALFILILALLVWQLDKAGVWVVAAGAWRYLFVAAGWWWIFLAGSLLPSRRRQTACVVQVICLIVCVCPFVPRALTEWIALFSILFLSGSFVVDGHYLYRARFDTDTDTDTDN